MSDPKTRRRASFRNPESWKEVLVHTTLLDEYNRELFRRHLLASCDGGSR
jgi:hypothetical protein